MISLCALCVNAMRYRNAFGDRSRSRASNNTFDYLVICREFINTFSQEYYFRYADRAPENAFCDSHAHYLIL